MKLQIVPNHGIEHGVRQYHQYEDTEVAVGQKVAYAIIEGVFVELVGAHVYAEGEEVDGDDSNEHVLTPPDPLQCGLLVEVRHERRAPGGLDLVVLKLDADGNLEDHPALNESYTYFRNCCDEAIYYGPTRTRERKDACQKPHVDCNRRDDVEVQQWYSLPSLLLDKDLVEVDDDEDRKAREEQNVDPVLGAPKCELSLRQTVFLLTESGQDGHSL